MGRPGEVSLELVNYIGERIRADAAKAREDAGMGGYHHDGGAGQMHADLSLYFEGFNRTLPKKWEQYEKDFRFSKDPEYPKFLELRKKFEGA